MAGTLTRAFKGLLKNRKSRDELEEVKDSNIGTPTLVSHNIHVTRNQDGALEGLPPELLQLAKTMLTAEEAQTHGTNDEVKNVLLWFNNRNKSDKQDFMHGDFLSGSPGSSGEGTSGTEILNSSKFYLPKPVPRNLNKVQEDQINANNSGSPEKSTETGEVKTDPEAGVDTPSVKEGATLRKKSSDNKGPRLTRNITEDEVYDRLRGLCSPGQPENKYKIDIELGSGAGGIVHLAIDRETKQRVAIKRIELAKQPKKEMILMEIRVMKELNHKNLVNFIEAYLLDTTLWVVMEFLAGK